MKLRLITICVLFYPALRVCANPPKASDFPLYTGRSVCLKCHSKNSPGEEGRKHPCTLEDIPEHDQSFDALTSIHADSIAALSGLVEPPTRSTVCLECHAAAADEGLRWTKKTFQLEHGVQCESCHEAGSLHVESIRSNVKMIRTDHQPLIRRSDREDCKRCHVERPSHQEVLKRNFSLTPGDHEYKTPVQLAVSPDGDRLYITGERADKLIVVDVKQKKVIKEIAVGKRPHGVVVSADGQQVYVTNRAGGTLSVIDAKTLTVTTEVKVGFEPHGVAMDPDGKTIYVVNTADDTMTMVDVESLAVTRKLAMGGSPWWITINPRQRRALVTNVRPRFVRFRDPPQSEISVVDLVNHRVVRRFTVPDANMLQGIEWVPGSDVALFTLMRTKNLIPTSRLAQGWVINNGLGIVWGDGRVDQVLLDEPGHYFPDPMDIAVSPDGKTAIVTSGGADEVAIVNVDKLLDMVKSFSDAQREKILPYHLGMSEKFVVQRLAVGSNPRGVVFSPDGLNAFVVNTLDDSVSVIDIDKRTVSDTIFLGGPTYVTQLRWGEKVFHDADITYGQQFSCHSCHPDGHINGLTFDIEADGIGVHPVDNRTLRGIFDTPPFKWEGTNPSLHRQCGPRLAVFFTRIDPYTPEELDALVYYMCTIERMPNRYRKPEGLTLAQRRGKDVFERAHGNDGQPLSRDKQCVTCHNGAYRTNRESNKVFTTMWFDAPVSIDLGEEMFNTDEFGALGAYYFVDVGVPQKVLDVPHLRDIADSPPYLHNGSANSLEEIWTRFNMVDRHGATADLTRQQLNDLISYLKAQ